MTAKSALDNFRVIFSVRYKFPHVALRPKPVHNSLFSLIKLSKSEFLSIMRSLYEEKYSQNVRSTPNVYLKKIIENLNLESGEKILEVGCNRGDLLREIERKIDVNVYGVDVNEAAIHKCDLPNVLVANVTRLPFPVNMFEKTYSIHVLEHVEDLEKGFKELRRVMKPGGLSMHAFPLYPPLWPRGVDGALGDSLKITRNPVRALQLARKLHVHKLSPKKLLRFTETSTWRLLKSERIFVREEYGFSWIVILESV